MFYLQLLAQRSQKEDGINGVTEKSLTVSASSASYSRSYTYYT